MALTNREKQARWRERLKAKAAAFDQLQEAPAQAPAITPESVLEALEARPLTEQAEFLDDLLEKLLDEYVTVNVQDQRLVLKVDVAGKSLSQQYFESALKIGALNQSKRHCTLAHYEDSREGFLAYLQDHHDVRLSLSSIQGRIKVYNAFNRFGPDVWFWLQQAIFSNIAEAAATFITPETTEAEVRKILDVYVENRRRGQPISDATASLRRRFKHPA